MLVEPILNVVPPPVDPRLGPTADPPFGLRRSGVIGHDSARGVSVFRLPNGNEVLLGGSSGGSGGTWSHGPVRDLAALLDEDDGSHERARDLIDDHEWQELCTAAATLGEMLVRFDRKLRRIARSEGVVIAELYDDGGPGPFPV